jgi:hypothetical protein
LNFSRSITLTAVFSFALVACSGNPSGSSVPSSALPAIAPFAGATSVSITVVNTSPLAGIKVDLYTGTPVNSCPPFGHPCVKKVKQLARGTTAKNGKVTLTATFTSNDIVCAEALSGNTTVQVCKRPFGNSVTLDFK